MRDILILTEQDLRQCIALDGEAVDVVERAFSALATGRVEMPPILSMKIPDHNGELDVKTAYVPGFDSFAVKMSPGFFDNPKLGLASLNGLMVVLSAKTGLVDALLLDNGYLTDVRTAAAGAVAARHLAPKSVTTAGVIGAGVQARLQLEAARLVRPFEAAEVFARNAEAAWACAEELTETLGIPVRAAESADALMAACELVITTTPAEAPLIAADQLHPGLHITAMGSDAHNKNEIAPDALAAADVFVCDRISQSETVGELRAARASGVLDESFVAAELGDVIAGKAAGRSSDDQVTICDLTGTGVQDTAIAVHALAVAARAGLGARIKA